MENLKRSKKKGSRIAGFLFIIVLAIAVLTIYNPLGPVGEFRGEVLVSIPQGSSTTKIADILQEHRLIKNKIVFLVYSRLTGTDTTLKAGEYVIDSSYDLPQIIEKISKGQVQTVAFTIPEGYTVEQIADTLAAKGLADKKEFLELAKKGEFDYSFLSKHENVKYVLEGYLFPDTYHINPTSSAKEIIQVMLKRFEQVYDEKARLRAKELGLNDQELITLASLIEKEAKVKEDRPLISGVIHNRMEIGMQLQIDATIQYILEQPKPRLMYKDLEVDSPYNTYQIGGLPPGPIASPGKAAIEAALYPEKTDYLYYLAKSDGSHVFSKTLNEHNSAKKKYLNYLN